METMDGNTAAAYVSYGFTEVAGIFPITPSSPMAELVDEWAARGKKNFFGRPVRVMEMQSEAGAAGVVHGALQGGAYATTYTASQGLLPMIPNMYRIAGELLPAVFHVSARTLANNAWSIFGEHQDVMATRQTGFAMFASDSVQDVMNFAAVAHLVAIGARVPCLRFFDGFRSSHVIQRFEILEEDELRSLSDWSAIRAFRDGSLSPDRPDLRGTTVNPDVYFQLREAVNPHYLDLPAELDRRLGEINRLTGRDYGFFDYSGAPDADRVVVAMGSACSTIRETVDYLNARGERVGLVCVRVFRPFLPERLRAAFPGTVEKIAVLDRTKENAAAGEPLYVEVRSAFYGAASAPEIVGGRYGLRSKEFTPSMAVAVFENLKSDRPKNWFTVGIVDDVSGTSLPMPPEPVETAPAGTVSCTFWGLGADGTVGANKNTIRIIGGNTDMYAQGYFAYDSKKSGGVTISHLRFGERPIASARMRVRGRLGGPGDSREGIRRTDLPPRDFPSRLYRVRRLRQRLSRSGDRACDEAARRRPRRVGPAPGLRVEVHFIQAASRGTDPDSEGKPVRASAARVLGSVRGMRRNAVRQAPHATVRRPDDRRQHGRMHGGLGRQLPVDRVHGERKGAGACVRLLALRELRRIRPRNLPRREAEP